jgi:cobaltochelatase CobT
MSVLQRRSPATIKQVIAIATGAAVRVSFRGDQAYTDGREIVLPAMISPKAEKLAVPYAWHESAHILKTDFDVWNSAEDRFRKTPIAHKLCNALEDGRIEVEMRSEFPGVHQRINELIAALSEEDTLFAEPEPEIDPANALLGYVLNWTRKQVNGYAAIVYLDQWRERLRASIGDELLQKVDEILDEEDFLVSTAKAIDVAFELTDLIQGHADSEDPDNNGDSGEGEPNSGDGQGGDGSESSAEDQSGQQDDEASNGQSDPDGDDQSQGGAGDEKSDKDGSEPSAGGAGQKTSDDSKDKPGDANQSSNTQGEADPKQRQKQRAAAKSIGEAKAEDLRKTDLGDLAGESINDKQQAHQDGQAGGSQIIGDGLTVPRGGADRQAYQAIAATASTLGSRLRGVIQAEVMSKDNWARRSGKRLDRRRLVRVSLDDDRIWKKRVEQIDATGHVHVLLDTSGSMKPHLWMLESAGLATARAIESVDELTCSVSTLPLRDGIRILKAVSENTSTVAQRFSALSAEGGTPMTHAINVIQPLLFQGDTSNRILVIFTDGAPDDHASMKQVIDRLESSGVVSGCIILGNQQNPIEKMMSTQRLKSLSDLPLAVTNLVAELVRKRIRKAA